MALFEYESRRRLALRQAFHDFLATQGFIAETPIDDESAFIMTGTAFRLEVWNERGIDDYWIVNRDNGFKEGFERVIHTIRNPDPSQPYEKELRRRS